MRKHVKVYLEANGYTVADIIPCEIRVEGCGNMAVDICHIRHRGMGGQPSLDVEENLVAGCRNCHDKNVDEDILREIARKRIERRESC